MSAASSSVPPTSIHAPSFPPTRRSWATAARSAIVRIDSTRATFAVRELGEESVARRLSDGGVEVEVPCTNLDAFRSWLFGWGVHAEVVAPADVRAELDRVAASDGEPVMTQRVAARAVRPNGCAGCW